MFEKCRFECLVIWTFGLVLDHISDLRSLELLDTPIIGFQAEIT